MAASTGKVNTPADECFEGSSAQGVRKEGVLDRLEIIGDSLKKYEEKVLKLQGRKISTLTDKVKIHEEQVKELLHENEAWKVKNGKFEDINKKIDSYSEQLQGSLRTNVASGKDLQLETSWRTNIEEANKELEKYKEEIKETYAQVVKEKETIKELWKSKPEMTNKKRISGQQLGKNW
ncbi:uncharacterized protein PF3D7_1120000-like [Procambarus clarkii]|uniref:uncharacterized protein PF3D7_1120000-like n=1 Tax=Procambarus clarkii TaxID=6728 RepID=UPI003743B09E